MYATYIKLTSSYLPKNQNKNVKTIKKNSPECKVKEQIHFLLQDPAFLLNIPYVINTSSLLLIPNVDIAPHFIDILNS